MSTAPPLFDPSLFTTPADVIAIGGLWDFLGFPLVQPPSEACPNDYLRGVHITRYGTSIS